MVNEKVTIQRNRWERKKARNVTVQSALYSFILAFEVSSVRLENCM